MPVINQVVDFVALQPNGNIVQLFLSTHCDLPASYDRLKLLVHEKFSRVAIFSRKTLQFEVSNYAYFDKIILDYLGTSSYIMP